MNKFNASVSIHRDIYPNYYTSIEHEARRRLVELLSCEIVSSIKPDIRITNGGTHAEHRMSLIVFKDNKELDAYVKKKAKEYIDKG